jgi:guanylate kinase
MRLTCSEHDLRPSESREARRVLPVDWSNLPGSLVVVSGASGTGKSTLVRRVLERPDVHARLSISATTRPIRPGEADGTDYYFLSQDEFLKRRDQDEFLEWAEVHGNFYGTPAPPVADSLRQGRSVVLEIDVQGALQVQNRVPSAVLVFVHAPSMEVLESRLRARCTDNEATIQKRLTNARGEIEQASRYDHQIINDDLETAVAALAAILNRKPVPPGTPTEASR